jgi:hypothetical protein
MAKNIEVDININSNTEATIKNLRALKKQLRETAAGSDEFNKIAQQIRDMDDAIKDANATSDDFLGYLEGASGPLGVLGRGIRGAEKTFSSFNGVLKASVIGILVASIGGLVAAFTQSETAMKKLEPLFIGMEKILGGIFKVFEPLLDAFIELALTALPYITKGIGGFYSGLFALFTLIKNVGVGAGKILKGIFTLDFNSIKEGYTQLTGSWNAAVEEFKAANKRFEAGSNELTKTEKANSKTRVETKQKEKTDKDKIIDSELLAMREFQNEYESYLNRLADLQNQYNTEIEDLQADTDQKKLDLWYRRKAKEIELITNEQGEKNNLYALLETERAIKQAEIEKKREDDLLKIRQDGEDARLAYEQKISDDAKRNAEIEFETKKQLQLQYADVVGRIGSLLRQAAGENKDLAIAGILLEQASAVASIAINSQKNAAKAGYLTPVGIAELAAGAIGITSAIIAAKQGIDAINASGVPSGGSGGGSGGSTSAPAAPRFNVVGTSGANQIAQTLGKDLPPVKAYVVANDVTSAQSLSRNIVSSASLG